jgi:hypothetical protein
VPWAQQAGIMAAGSRPVRPLAEAREPILRPAPAPPPPPRRGLADRSGGLATGAALAAQRASGAEAAAATVTGAARGRADGAGAAAAAGATRVRRLPPWPSPHRPARGEPAGRQFGRLSLRHTATAFRAGSADYSGRSTGRIGRHH